MLATNYLTVKLDTVEKCDKLLAELAAMSSEEREEYKCLCGLRDCFGLDVVTEIINIIGGERKFLLLPEDDKIFFHDAVKKDLTGEEHKRLNEIYKRLGWDWWNSNAEDKAESEHA